MKTFILIIFLFILGSLFTALYHLVNPKENSQKMVKALIFRMGISILLFVVILIAYALGFIGPGS